VNGPLRALVTAGMIAIALSAIATDSRSARAQVINPGQALLGAPARAIAAPKRPLPSEDASAGVTKFSFIAYGDTRGSRDGFDLQQTHALVVNRILDVIRQRSSTSSPIMFVLQSGDAVTSGRDPAQWNASFSPLIDRITTEGGVPYFLAPGNHDLTSSTALDNPIRQAGLRNYLGALANLIPPSGSPRRFTDWPAFAFGYGNTFVLSIDSNLSPDRGQLAWARGQFEGLDRARYVNLVALMHHPAFSSGPHGGPSGVEAESEAIRELYMPLFRQMHVRLVIAGHDHFFEHWVEHYADESNQPRRIDLVTTAGGGAPTYYYEGEPATSAYEGRYAAAKVHLEHLVKPGSAPGSNPFHFVVLSVDGASMSLEVVTANPAVAFKPYGKSGAGTSLDVIK